MNEKLTIIPGYKRYSITEDGQIFNNDRKVWLKAYKNKSGYYSYHLYNKHIYVHRLVALTYLEKPIDKGYEVDHIDQNKGNNHYTNLQWISHSDNVKLSFSRGNRGSWWKGKTRPSPAIETRILMANAKKKPVRIYKDNELIKECESVNQTAEYFNVTRITIFKAIKIGSYKGYKISALW